MPSKEYWIKTLGLTPHIEGGYYKEILKSDDRLVEHHNRALYTSIYFLLDETQPSHLHRLTADEVWYFHCGTRLTVHCIFPEGTYQVIHLGSDSENGEVFQACVPKGTIFGATVDEGYALVSCMVSPGFEYQDFELLSRQQLLSEYPQYTEIITRLTREEV